MSAEIVVFAVLICVVLLFAIISNALVICCVAKFKRLRTFTNVFICNLSVSDILLAGLVMPQRLHHIFHKEDFYEGEELCKIANFGPIFIISSSIYTLVVVSFERHKAIIDSRGPKLTVYTLILLIVSIWILALIISIPTLMEYSLHEEDITEENETHLHCGSDMTFQYSLANAISVVVFAYLIPVILLFKNYLDIAVFVWRKGKMQKQHVSSRNRNLSSFVLFKHRTKLVKLLVMVALIFAISWLPYFVLLLYAKVTGNDASKKDDGPVNLFLIALAAFSTGYNVVLYVIFNPSFKRAMGEFFKCKATDKSLDQQTLNDTNNTRVFPCSGDDTVNPINNRAQIFSVQTQLSS